MKVSMTESNISKVQARELLDSKGRPMVTVEIECNSGIARSASAPCGTSVGSYEAFVLRDGDARYDGLGVRNAVEKVNSIVAPELIGIDVCEQEVIDDLLISLDATPDKHHLGANAIYSISAAAA